ncbi:PEP-CTERM system TPR-repeat protein PrsT [Oxalobacteraceae bacterium OTU3REALA1]|nr:PEP-CTERM system TPR-repeat protein PrsT [Oxalobacteraceae bacterium OTU3REALA1]
MPPSPVPYPLLRALLASLILSLVAGCGRTQSDDQLLSAARQHVARGEPKSAVIQLKNLLQQTPANGPARLMLGQLYLDTGDTLSAEKELRRALELGTNPGDVAPLLGRTLLLQGQYDKILDEIKADEQQPKLMALRGHALVGLNRIDEASELFEQTLVRHPDNPAALLGLVRLALHADKHDAAMALVERALAHTPNDVDAWRQKGDLLRLQGKNPEALLAYQKVLTLHPVQVQAHVDIASLHIQSGKLKEASAELGIARRVSQNNLMLIYTQALLDFREGKLAVAQENLQRVLRAAPDHLPSNLLMGAVLRGLGLFTQAEQYLRKFLETNQGHPYASKLLATVLMNTGMPAQALALIDPLLPSHQEDLEMLTLAGEINMRLRQFTKAAGYLERAAKLAPQETMLHAALAMSHMGMGDNNRAIAELERATKMDVKSSRAGVLLVLSQLRNKEYAKALEAVKRLEAQQEGNPMVQNLKGGVLLMNRDNAGARASFEKALKFEPLYMPALNNLTQMDLKEKKPEQARQRLQAALAKDKKSADVMGALADLALTQSRQPEARTWLEQVVRDHADNVEASLRLVAFYASTNEASKALVLAQKLQATNPSNSNVLAMLAELQTRGGDKDGSLENWTKLAVLQPSSAELQLRIADAHAAVKDNDGAAKALNKALSLRPDYPQAQVALTRLLIGQRDWALALQTVRGFQKAHSDGPLGYKLEGDVLMAQKQMQLALALYQKAYDLQPSGPTLIPLYSALVQSGKTPEARTRMRQWLDKHADDRTTRLYFANSLLAEKDFPASIAQFEHLLKLTPNHPVVMNNLAWLYQQQKDPRALGMAEQANKAAPADPIILDTLGWILVEQGKLDRAVPLLKQAAALAPANTDIRNHLGIALGKSGKSDEKQAAR